MTAPTKSNALQSYQVLLYNRALHPELFALKARRVVRSGPYELEMWAMQGAHLLRFEKGALCCSELLTAQESQLPTSGIVSSFLAAGDRDFEHRFTKDRVTYMTTVQSETLSENLYLAIHEEMLDHAREIDGLLHRWSDDTGQCLSLLEAQRYSKEVHVQAYHLIAHGGIVLRTQTIFEIA